MVQAIIWDYDGTLVDTRRKNLEVTKEIMRHVIGDNLDRFPILTSLENYHAANEDAENWRSLYRKHFNLAESQIDKAGAMWKEYQLNNNTPAPLFEYIRDTLNSLDHYRHGIVSQNAYKNIHSYLTKNQLQPYFSKIIGYEEIGYDQQKPNPTGLLNCIDHINNQESGAILYIGDHETDTRCAHRANEVLTKNNRNIDVLSVAALYGATKSTDSWQYKPDFEARSPMAIADIVARI